MTPIRFLAIIAVCVLVWTVLFAAYFRDWPIMTASIAIATLAVIWLYATGPGEL